MINGRSKQVKYVKFHVYEKTHFFCAAFFVRARKNPLNVVLLPPLENYLPLTLTLLGLKSAIFIRCALFVQKYMCSWLIIAMNICVYE